ncbi:MAG: 16S rRNA (guanine(527)-N(7))-methyltransferase RsmG [Gracilibacteraceae bacterium]|nr:16S rRNA (guanine(527)-N(7))-methyltransferase RsmG [Gracilibacteraceae bacterium]
MKNPAEKSNPRFGAAEADLLRREAAARWDLTLTDRQLAQFGLFGDMLLAWNRKMNLTAITEPAEIARKHFLDSLALLPYAQAATTPSAGPLLDLGAGAGFPGLPLKLAWPESEWVLGDSLGKRLIFIEAVIRALGLSGARTLAGRAEDWGRGVLWRGRFACVTARAVAPLPVLTEYALPLLRPGGVLLAAKGPAAREEAAQAGRALALCGGEVREIADCAPANGSPRFLVVVVKTRETPDLYPRAPGRPKKKPL